MLRLWMDRIPMTVRQQLDRAYSAGNGRILQPDMHPSCLGLLDH